MVLAYVACFLVVLQVASANHNTITESLPTETTSEFMTDFSDNFTDIEDVSTQTADSTDESTVSAEVDETTTIGLLNASMTTVTDATPIVDTIPYVTVTDDPSTTVEPTMKPKPIENMATVLSQPGIMILLPVLVRLVPLWWCR